MFEIGNTLREARVRRTLTLQQVEEDTKIRVKYIQAMENEDWDVMPGATYVKGFLRTYSTYLGLDADVILDEYRSRAAPVRERYEPFGGSSTLGGPRRHRGRNTIMFVALICLLVLGVFYIIGLDSDEGGEPATKPSALGIASASPSASPSESPSKTPSPEVSATVKPGMRNVVRVAAVDGDCWVQVRRDDSDGVVLYSGTLTDGDSESFKSDVLWVRLGNPSAVKMTVQGRAADTPGGVDPIDLVIKDGKVKRQD